MTRIGCFREVAAVLLLASAAVGNGGPVDMSMVVSTGNLRFLNVPGVELLSEELNIAMERDHAVVRVVYRRENHGATTRITYGFPVETFDRMEWEPEREDFSSFRFTVDGVTVAPGQPVAEDTLTLEIEGMEQSGRMVRSWRSIELDLAGNGQIQGVELADGQRIRSRYVIEAPGRSGSRWMKREAESLGLKSKASPVDIGVRVELPAIVLKDITDAVYESKLIHYSKTFDDKVRTFCMNPYGEVVCEEFGDVKSVNGHSYTEAKSENTNFAILVSSIFTEPFDDPIGYGRYITGLANLLGRGVIVQRLGDLLSGRRSTPTRIAHCLTRPTLSNATPGDLSFVLPYRHLVNILEMLQALDKLAPGVYSRHTLLYGVEVKFYSNRIYVTPEMETEIPNLFVVGDGAGVSRGLLQASASGILAARAVGKRLREESSRHHQE